MEQSLTKKFVDATEANLRSTLVKANLAGFFAGLSQGMVLGAFAFLYRQGSLYAADLSKPLPLSAASPLEAMFVPIFVFFLMAMGLGQAFNGATDTSKASSAAGRVFEAGEETTSSPPSVAVTASSPPSVAVTTALPASSGEGWCTVQSLK
jgi:ABC-type multidrug transport system fused ATPase/permease subunit